MTILEAIKAERPVKRSRWSDAIVFSAKEFRRVTYSLEGITEQKTERKLDP